MKITLTILLILLLPLSLFAISNLSESDLSGVTTNNSLNITPSDDSNSISKFWTRYFTDPSNIDFLSNEESSDTNESKANQTSLSSRYQFPDFTATVSVVESNDPYKAGMSHIEFSSGLIKTDEGPTTVEVWLGGLANDKNAGKMCDFYSNQIRSYTYPHSAINVSTH